ncbi:NAD(P)-dependent dehydrogenase (short-subunit alcohol dehydrogenase family) [Spinactinospora alkalitolerans]|uniref:NAD(P)-dependent dehydrogenase (Short-subunit alcohol dehydrogenase family) n=1 Tax=Spinactinospora alkalitolerans TaxID=687207 RepID=A0A852TXT1_9ACTN|nr:SDR family NAD(P)-dependent oxidoreductase [Spinactinospora alkalitolerans]NYE49326.1 NAD(P)-dependent dehydrogenase (short-subunit alcohol dehydrogenase family) [Spinactinospora alkalitolerans]
MTASTLRDLSGRTAIVTGASGAFGGATLRVLRHLGAEAVGIDRKPDDGVLACDVTDDAQVCEVLPEAVERLGGRLDRLIHFAGVGPAVDIGTAPGAEVHEALEVNLLGAWRVTAAAMPALLRERGRVVLTASLLAGVSMPFTGAYTVSKRALTAYADTLRAEYGTHIGVTTIHPGYVDTPIHDRSRAVGVSLDGLVPAELVRDTAMTAVRAAAARTAHRDLASTPLGTGALRLARHAPALVDRIVSGRIGRLVATGHFAGADLARGLHRRHGAGTDSPATI